MEFYLGEVKALQTKHDQPWQLSWGLTIFDDFLLPLSSQHHDITSSFFNPSTSTRNHELTTSGGTVAKLKF